MISDFTQRSMVIARDLLGATSRTDVAYAEAALTLSRWAADVVAVVEYDRDNDILYVDFDAPTLDAAVEFNDEEAAEVMVELDEALAYTWVPAGGFARITGVCLAAAAGQFGGELGGRLRAIVGEAVWTQAQRSVDVGLGEPVIVPIGTGRADELLQHWTIMVGLAGQSERRVEEEQVEGWARNLTDDRLREVVAEWSADLLEATAAGYRADALGPAPTFIRADVGDEAFAVLLCPSWTVADGPTSVEITVADRLMTVSVPLPGPARLGLSVQARVDLGEKEVVVLLISSAAGARLPELLSGTHELDTANSQPRRVTLAVHAEAAGD